MPPPAESADCEPPIITPPYADALRAAIVLAALQRVDEKHRTPLGMLFLRGPSCQEMPGLLAGAVMSRMSRGKELVRKRLEAPAAVAINGRHVGSPPRRQGSEVAAVP